MGNACVKVRCIMEAYRKLLTLYVASFFVCVTKLRLSSVQSGYFIGFSIYVIVIYFALLLDVIVDNYMELLK